MLALRLEFLTGRYVASAFNDRRQAEWPPHPARLFSALVAAHYESGASAAGERALKWLEQQPPPHIRASGAAFREVKTHFVPVNDKAVSDSATVDRAWAKLAAAGDDAKRRTKAEAALSKAYANAGARQNKLGKNDVLRVRHVMPVTRTKQARAFPSVTPHDPVVVFGWQATADHETRAGLQVLARGLARVGHSSSLVAACWLDDLEDISDWIPDARGEERLRWVGPGQLEALTALHRAEPFGEQRVMPYVVARYRTEHPEPKPPRSCFARSFIVLRRAEGPRVPIEATEGVAHAVRGALMSHASDPPPALISGHTPDGAPLPGDHLAIVPLPYVGSERATGDLLGVALIPPAGLDLDQLRPLHAAIAAWEQAEGAHGDSPRLRLNLGRAGVWICERVLDRERRVNLREPTWTRRSTSWASATPVLLDRYPGTRDAEGRARASIVAACERIGLPAPVVVEFSGAPFFRGSAPARRFRRRPGTRDTRPLIHVGLEFSEPVRGPVLLGAGRYRGLGLFRPYGVRRG